MQKVLLVVLALYFLGTLAQDEDGRCEYCVDKECGPNGIGGSCGECAFGSSCQRGRCVCDRGCDGRECGVDACGTLCGECLPGQVCDNGICVGDCTPQCTRPDGTLRTCGWDRCGRLDRCGTCPDADDCQFRCRDGTCECVPTCDGKHCGPDGCGGTCGECEDGAFCQGDLDNFPGQCYFDCLLEMRIEVRELQTDRLIIGEANIDMTCPTGEFRGGIIYPGSVPGFVTVDVSTCKFGEYSFTTSSAGYITSFETRSYSAHLQLITLYLDWNLVQIEVRDEATNQLLPAADISIVGTGYNLNVDWVSPIYTWNHGGFMGYTFTTSATGYTTRTASEEVTISTTLIVLFLGKGAIPIVVTECLTGDSVSTATITVSGQTINYNGGASFTPNDGFITYSFTTASTGYLTNTQSVSVTASTTLIELCVNFSPIPFTVTDCASGALIDGATVEASSNFYASYSLTFTHFSAGTTWTPVGFQGQYEFFATATGYNDGVMTTSVSAATSSLTMCLDRSAFCGDGQCNGDETANPTQATRCGDCGRIRGVISLAVGQKDQLNNITISVWAHPTNPALNLRAGTPVPNPDFTTVSDSKGFFSAGVLNFDAPAESVAFGSFSRRFYFRLSGTFTDRTDGQETEITLLPLWWNYELTNLQYSGSGDVAGSNNSPSFYFYMTPPFPTADALVRVILSWGTLKAQSAISIPDIDLVVAGPVTQESLNTYNNTGVVNFSNKDIHSEINELPFVKIITDSAQSFGPEVIDFYGNPATPELDIGFSSSYAPGAAANVYEIWVDKPNSQPNEELVFNFIAETNAFLVYYINDGAVNEQLLFDAATGVEYAYGFWNGDQWNQVPADATLWHVTDISDSGIIFDGFSTVANEPGTKYGFDAGFFEPQKTLPCGHVAARGATPSYCPAILDYPQSNKK